MDRHQRTTSNPLPHKFWQGEIGGKKKIPAEPWVEGGILAEPWVEGGILAEPWVEGGILAEPWVEGGILAEPWVEGEYSSRTLGGGGVLCGTLNLWIALV